MPHIHWMCIVSTNASKTGSRGLGGNVMPSPKPSHPHLPTAMVDRSGSSLKLDESEARFRELVNSAPDGIVIVDRDGRITLVNDQAEKMFGYEKGQLNGQPHDLLLHGNLRATHGRHRADYFAEPHRRPMGGAMELVGLRKDGSEFPVSISLSPVDTPEGLNVISVVRDVTEQRAAEGRVRRSERRLAEAQRLAHLGSWDWEIQSEELHWSDEMCEIFGVTQAELDKSNETFFRALHPEDREQVKHAVDQALRHGRPHDLEFRITRPDGGLRVIHGQGEVLEDANGAPARLIGTVVDITERRRIEEELGRHRENLEELVIERTRDLEGAMNRAQAADRLKSTFLAAMSHELRTPLNSIIGFSGILLAGSPGPLNEEQKTQLGMVQKSARHLLGLINEVLDLSKIEAGQLEIRTEPFDLRMVIDKVVLGLMPLAEDKGISLATHVVPEVGIIDSDRRRVEQILINLVNNAVKFTEEGSVRVDAFIADGRLTTSVKDTGIGIHPEHFDVLFESFRQVDSGLARRNEGTGLGLSISRRLAELLGGRIRVESEEGVGSTFSFDLPLDPEEAR